MIELRHKAIAEGTSVQQAYDDFFQDHTLLMRDSYYLWILELLNPQPGAVLVDVACGNGRLVELAARRSLRAVGLDLSYEGIVTAAAAAPIAGWVCANGQGMPLPTASVDYVVSSGSLEHYDQPLQGVRELSRILKPTGKAYILLPNAFGLFGNILHITKTGEIFDDAQPLQRYGTRATWSRLLQQGGLVIEDLIPFNEVNAPRTGKDVLWTLAHPQKAVRAALAAMTPLNLANHFVFICRPGAGADLSHYPTLPWA